MHAPTQDGASAVLHAATTDWGPASTQPAQLYKPQPHELRVSNLFTNTERQSYSKVSHADYAPKYGSHMD